MTRTHCAVCGCTVARITRIVDYTDMQITFEIECHGEIERNTVSIAATAQALGRIEPVVAFTPALEDAA